MAACCTGHCAFRALCGPDEYSSGEESSILAWSALRCVPNVLRVLEVGHRRRGGQREPASEHARSRQCRATWRTGGLPPPSLVSKRTVASARDHRSRRHSRTSAGTTSFALPSSFGTRLGVVTGLPGMGRGSPFTESSSQVTSFGVFLRDAACMTSELVERLLPEGLWDLFQRVVPPARSRPQGRGLDGDCVALLGPTGWCLGSFFHWRGKGVSHGELFYDDDADLSAVFRDWSPAVRPR